MGNKVAEHLNISAMHRQSNNKAIEYQWLMVILPLSTIVLSCVRIQSFALVRGVSVFDVVQTFWRYIDRTHFLYQVFSHRLEPRHAYA